MPEDTLVRGLIETLRSRGHLRLVPGILRLLEADRASEREETLLTLARTGDRERLAKDIAKAATELGVSAEVAAVRTDETLVGGFTLSSGNRLLDRSYKRALVDLYRTLTASY